MQALAPGHRRPSVRHCTGYVPSEVCRCQNAVFYVVLLNIYTAGVDLQSRLCIFKSLAVPYVANITFVHEFSIGL